MLGYYDYGYVLCRYVECAEGNYWVDEAGDFIEAMDENGGPDMWMHIPKLPIPGGAS